MTPCIIWSGYIAKSGYGQACVPQPGGRHKVVGAHRLAWERANGPIPKGLCVCHRCDVRSCVNVDHLWLGTHAENIADRDAKGRHRGNGQKEWTHCKAGHEFTPENTYINKTSGQRVCRQCAARWTREWRARKQLTN